jgi:hypothetical protein
MGKRQKYEGLQCGSNIDNRIILDISTDSDPTQMEQKPQCVTVRCPCGATVSSDITGCHTLGWTIYKDGSSCCPKCMVDVIIKTFTTIQPDIAPTQLELLVVECVSVMETMRTMQNQVVPLSDIHIIARLLVDKMEWESTWVSK